MDELKPTINEILRGGNQLLKNGFGDEKLSNDLASINGNRRKCVDEAPVLEKDLENLANDCKKLNDGISDVGSKLDAIEDKKNALKSIGTDADAIKEQMEEVKVNNLYKCSFIKFSRDAEKELNILNSIFRSVLLRTHEEIIKFCCPFLH